ncbi:MAG TPA: hypothetical protein DDZ80_12320 [Cyanobacteria bacterium UBA8803]|nr:hypothetical protein [Cyanobacteria bacterium UBA9273]HBL59264.1 hypothetical protein [Cyanobacteria bacterium UBA8803]
MTSATVKRFVFTPLVVSATVFAALTIPLQLFRSTPVRIQLQDEPLIFGQVEEFAPQYLGVAAALSVSAGIVSMAALGWQQSSRKSALVEQELSNLVQNLNKKQELLEVLQKPPQVTFKGQIKKDSPRQQVEDNQHLVKSVSASLHPSVSEPDSATESSMGAQTQLASLTEQAMTQKAASGGEPLAITDPPQEPSTETSEVEELDHQLQELMDHIASVQKVLRSNPKAANLAVQLNKKLGRSFLVER